MTSAGAAVRGAATIVLLLGGCTPLPVGTPVPVAGQGVRHCSGSPTPAEYRLPDSVALPDAAAFTRSLALGEWSGWGGQIVDYRQVDGARSGAVRALVRDGGQPADEDLVLPAIIVLGCWENDPRMFHRLRAYWRGVPRERPTGDLLDSAVALTVERPGSWSEAWSAAFVSYVLRGSTERYPAMGGFSPSENHAGYVAAALEEGRHRYTARPPAIFVPRAGDLVCSYRNQPRREPWRPENAGWRLGSAHCDIVVAAERAGGAGRIFVVGGNIFQSVTLSVHATDGQGRLVDSRFRNWAIVLADRANPEGL